MTVKLPVASSQAHDIPHAGDHAGGSRTPFDFHEASEKAAHDERLKKSVNYAVLKQYVARQEMMASLPNADALRTLAGQIKQHALDHLDFYLEQSKTNVEKRGGHVHFASNGPEAREIIMKIARDAGCKKVIKSKSMVSEEIELAHHMEAAGLEVVETDLGEFIVQMDHDTPSHIVAPIVHKDRKSIATLFSAYFGTPYK